MQMATSPSEAAQRAFDFTHFLRGRKRETHAVVNSPCNSQLETPEIGEGERK
jgi:hypothetical protein